jgi:uncharacterized protein (TIGR03437 family)
MLRLTVCFLIASFLVLVNNIFGPPRVESFASLTRLTNTPEHALNLNPTLSDEGKVVVFESSADLAGVDGNASFHAIRTEFGGVPDFTEIGATRAVSPALSSDGRIIAFASMEDLVGENADRNSEIFLFDGERLRQVTHTEPDSLLTRLTDGNFQPSITADGSTIVFSSNRGLLLYDTRGERLTQLADAGAVSPKISADGSCVYYIKVNADNTDLVRIETGTGLARVIAANVAGLALTEGRAISNDGMRVVYSASTAPNQSQVFLFDGRDNSIRQLTQLGSRVVDVRLQPTISGDGRRVAFATRRRVTNASDGGVELYVLDVPTGQIEQITNAPATATAEVVASLNFDGTRVAFNFPRILSGVVSDDDLRNNSEVYVAELAPRPVGVASVLNAAAQGNELDSGLIAPGSIASIRGNALTSAAGTTVTVNGRAAEIFYAAADEVVFIVPDGVANGRAEFLVNNGDGLLSKAEAFISGAAPGVFTVAGNGRGDAIVLDSDTLSNGPFDPSGGQSRLSIFATGVAHAKSVAVTICGKQSVVETVAPANLVGLDEVHVLVPAELRGAGKCTLVVTADGVQSNATSVAIGGAIPAATPTPTPIPTPTPTPSPVPSPSPSPSPDASQSIVISQIFGGGGNAGAPLRNDFIEIFNSSSMTFNLSGWSVQYASATASTWSVTSLTSVNLLPGQYYLIQESSGGSNGVVLPGADATGTIAMAAGAGKVALVKNSTALTGACPSDPNIVDFAGYGATANCFRGLAPAVAPSNTNAIMRAANGCSNTRNNVADFALAAPNPRNTSFLPRICTN